MDEVRYTLRQLEYFVAVAEAGSLTAAAERCSVSQTAVSLGITELERILRTQLVLRHRARGVELTSAGRRLLVDALSLLRQAEQFQVGARDEGVAGRLTIGCYLTLSPVLLAVLAGGFTALHPKVEIGFEEGAQPALEEALLAGRADVAILYRSGVHPGFDVEPLADVLPHVVLPEGHRLADEHAVSLRELADDPMVLFDVSPSRDHWFEMVSDLGIEPLVAYRTRSFETTRCLVGQGLGYAVLVQRSQNPGTYDGSRVVTRPILEAVRPRSVIAAYPSGMRLPDKARAFLDYCRAEVPRLIGIDAAVG